MHTDLPNQSTQPAHTADHTRQGNYDGRNVNPALPAGETLRTRPFNSTQDRLDYTSEGNSDRRNRDSRDGRDEQTDARNRAHQDTVRRAEYMKNRVNEKVLDLIKEEAAENETRIRAKALSIVESELRPFPGNPTLEEITAHKEFRALEHDGKAPYQVEAERVKSEDTKIANKSTKVESNREINHSEPEVTKRNKHLHT